MFLGKHGYEPDSVDLQLLKLLQEDCKIPLAKLGEAVGMSAPSVMERIRKLEAAGVIKGYKALIDARRVGLDITAFIGVNINYPKAIDEFERSVAQIPSVLECHHVTGAHTMLLKIRTENTASLEKLISEIRATPGVDRTETMIVLSTQTERTELTFDADAAVAEEEESPKPRARAARRNEGEHVS